MPRPRRQVQPLQEALSIQPVASSPDFFQRPNLARPTEVPIYDFAPISETVTGYLAQKAKDRHESQIQAGQRFADENPQLVARLEAEAEKIRDQKERSEFLRKEFDRLQKEGKIPAAADPYFQIGYARSAARQTVASYRERVRARVAEVTTLKDPKTGEYTSPVDPDSILAQEWERVSQSPAILNFYGGQEALAAKEGVDEEFRTNAGQERSRHIEQDYLENLQREVGTRFDAVLNGSTEVNSTTLQPVTDFITQEVRGHNVQNPRELTLQALQLSLQRIAATDPQEAVRAAYAAQDLVVGGVRLGDDRSGVGLALEDLKRRYVQEAEQHDSREAARKESARALAITKAEDEYVPALLQARRDGQSLVAVGKDLADKILHDDAVDKKYDGNGAFAVEALNKYVRSTDAARQSDQGLVQQINVLVADGRLDEADALTKSGLEGDLLTGESYAQSRTLIKQRRDVSQYVEGNDLVQTSLSAYDQAKPSGLNPEIQDVEDNHVIDLKRAFSNDLADWVKDNLADPAFEDKRRTWIREHQAADLGDIRDRATELRSKRDETDRDIRQRLLRFQDAEDLIAEGERTGAFTVSEAQGLREQNSAQASQRERFFSLPEYDQGLAALEADIQPDLPGQPLEAEDVKLLESARSEYRDRYGAGLDRILSDPAISPRSFDAQARVLARDVQREMEKQLFPEQRALAAQTLAGFKGGGTAAAIRAQIVTSEADLDASLQWAAVLRDPVARESITADSLLLPQHPAVPRKFYKDAALWVSGEDPFFGSPVTRQGMDATALNAARSVSSDPTLSEADRADAIGAIVSTVGISPSDVLQERAQFVPTPEVQDDARVSLGVIETLLKYNIASGAETDSLRAQIESIRPLAEGRITFASVKGYVYRPYTTPFFRSAQEMASFSDDVAWPEFLRRIGIDPDDKDAVDTFLVQQLHTIDRTTAQ